MNGKIAKQIRRFLRIKFPHLFVEGVDKETKIRRRRAYQEIKRRYKETPWNLRNAKNLS